MLSVTLQTAEFEYLTENGHSSVFSFNEELMHLSDIPRRLGETRTIILLGLSLLGMLIFGFVLANIDRERMVEETNRLNSSVSNLKAENERLQTQTNQLNVKLELERMRTEELKDEIIELQRDVFNLQKDKAFYEHVVAPETTQDGFFVDGLELFPTSTPGYFKATMVFLQQRAVSAMVRGNLKVSITGSLDGNHRTLTSGQNDILPEGEIAYGFKYFQAVTLYIQLPENFMPETMQLSTTVYQYKRRRGEYSRSYNWHEILVEET